MIGLRKIWYRERKCQKWPCSDFVSWHTLLWFSEKPTSWESTERYFYNMWGQKKRGNLWLLLIFIGASVAQKVNSNSCRCDISIFIEHCRMFDIFSLKTCVNLCCPEGEVFTFEEKAHRFGFGQNWMVYRRNAQKIFVQVWVPAKEELFEASRLPKASLDDKDLERWGCCRCGQGRWFSTGLQVRV